MLSTFIHAQSSLLTNCWVAQPLLLSCWWSPLVCMILGTHYKTHCEWAAAVWCRPEWIFKVPISAARLVSLGMHGGDEDMWSTDLNETEIKACLHAHVAISCCLPRLSTQHARWSGLTVRCTQECCALRCYVYARLQLHSDLHSKQRPMPASCVTKGAVGVCTGKAWTHAWRADVGVSEYSR